MSAMAAKTMQSVQTAANASTFSELIELAFQSYVQLLKKHPDFFGAPGQGGVDGQALFECACFAMHLPESGTVRASCSYLTHLVSASVGGGASNPALAAVVRSGGLKMVKNAVICAVNSDITSDNAEYVTNVFFYLGKHFFAELCQWLEAVVAEDGFPGPSIGRDKKQEFAQGLVKEKANKRKMQEVTRDFAATCFSLQGAGMVKGPV